MIISPQPGPQEKFLACKADIALYGGQAGGGKTHALIMEPLRHYNVKGFKALTFRRSGVEIRSPGGLWDASQELYNKLPPFIKPTPREQQLDWKFPSGATIKFAHLMNDNTIYEYQGTEICFLGFDEVTHFSLKQFTYLLSRNRSTCGIKPYVRATCNPDKDSWVRRWIDWWINPDTGLAIQERSGVIKYFTIQDDKPIWADTPEDLREYYSDLEWDSGARPRSFTFIPASIYDNKILLETDPNYLSSLKSQNKVERERLLGGNWNISYADFGAVLNRNDFNRFDPQEKFAIPGYFKEFYFVLDGASRTKEANDYSVLGLFAKSKIEEGKFFIIDWVRVKLEEPDLEQLIIDKWHQWKHLSIKGINVERGACGIGMMQRLPRKGIPVFELIPEKDKFLRLNDGLGIIKCGFVNVPVEASWAAKFFEECECFRADLKHALMDGETMPHDDQVDVLAYGLSSQINLRAQVSIFVKKPVQQPRKHGLGLM
jgi:predicted phage terminase large subunit-like protein